MVVTNLDNAMKLGSATAAAILLNACRPAVEQRAPEPVRKASDSPFSKPAEPPPALPGADELLDRSAQLTGSKALAGLRTLLSRRKPLRIPAGRRL